MGHYTRWRNHGDVMESVPLGQRRSTEHPCEFAGCDRLAKSLALCNVHRAQQRVGRTLTPIEPKGPWGGGCIDSKGYRILSMNTRRIFEHRYVMEQMLGRELLPGETVHHINGVKDDNRPSNLQLWMSAQTPGQKVVDIITWAHEILNRYENQESFGALYGEKEAETKCQSIMADSK